MDLILKHILFLQVYLLICIFRKANPGAYLCFNLHFPDASEPLLYPLELSLRNDEQSDKVVVLWDNHSGFRKWSGSLGSRQVKHFKLSEIFFKEKFHQLGFS